MSYSSNHTTQQPYTMYQSALVIIIQRLANRVKPESIILPNTAQSIQVIRNMPTNVIKSAIDYIEEEELTYYFESERERVCDNPPEEDEEYGFCGYDYGAWQQHMSLLASSHADMRTLFDLLTKEVSLREKAKAKKVKVKA